MKIENKICDISNLFTYNLLESSLTVMGWYTNYYVTVELKECMDAGFAKQFEKKSDCNVEIDGKKLVCKTTEKRGDYHDLKYLMRHIAVLLGDKFISMRGTFDGEDGYARAQQNDCDRNIELSYSCETDETGKSVIVIREHPNRSDETIYTTLDELTKRHKAAEDNFNDEVSREPVNEVSREPSEEDIEIFDEDDIKEEHADKKPIEKVDSTEKISIQEHAKRKLKVPNKMIDKGTPVEEPVDTESIKQPSKRKIKRKIKWDKWLKRKREQRENKRKIKSVAKMSIEDVDIRAFKKELKKVAHSINRLTTEYVNAGFAVEDIDTTPVSIPKKRTSWCCSFGSSRYQLDERSDEDSD